MRCSQCGSELGAGERFCGECGAPRPRLLARFAAVERQFAALKARYTAGELSDADYDAALQQLIIQDEAGRQWMIGAETEQWYCYDGGQWLQAEPPLEAAEPSEARPQGVPPVEAAPRAAPLQRAGCQRGTRIVLTVLGGLLVLCALSCLSLFALRRSINQWIVNEAIERGYPVTVVATAPGAATRAPAATSTP